LDAFVDKNIESIYSSKNKECFLGWDFGEGFLADISAVRFFLDVSTSFDKFLGSTIEVSNDREEW